MSDRMFRVIKVAGLHAVLLLSILNWGRMHAQQDTAVQFLSYENYINLVLDHHPVMQRAVLLGDQAQAYILKAKGSFDPKLEANWNSKDFDDKDYYRLLDGSLTVPLWFGADVKVSYERNAGLFIDNSDALPDDGLWSIGVNVPLGAGLFFDERRQVVLQSRLYEEANEIERINMLNDLLLDASIEYLSWQKAQEYVRIAQEGVDLAEQRFEGVRAEFTTGDGPAIDSLEAFINLQSRRQDMVAVNQNLAVHRALLNNYLWLEGDVPLEMSDDLHAEPLDPELLKAIYDEVEADDEIILKHPYLRLYDNKLALQDLDRRLAQEYMKPDVFIGFHPLADFSDGPTSRGLTLNDYKLSVNISTPLFLRKERGNLRLVDVKIADTKIERTLKQRDIETQILQYRIHEAMLTNQIEILDRNIQDYRDLLDAEYLKLEIGESSIFVVNSREVKYLELQEKYISLAIKRIENRVKGIYYSGQLESRLR